MYSNIFINLNNYKVNLKNGYSNEKNKICSGFPKTSK